MSTQGKKLVIGEVAQNPPKPSRPYRLVIDLSSDSQAFMKIKRKLLDWVKAHLAENWLNGSWREEEMLWREGDMVSPRTRAIFSGDAALQSISSNQVRRILHRMAVALLGYQLGHNRIQVTYAGETWIVSANVTEEED